MPSKKTRRRGFGAIRVLPSGRYQASYIGPDLARHPAPHTFETQVDAEGWLAAERRLAAEEDWTPPRARGTRARAGLTLAEYAPGAIDRRRVRGEPLKPRTRALYLGQLERLILPDLGDKPLAAIRASDVTRWHDALPADKPTQRAHAYSLLRTLMGQAVTEGIITASPCAIRGAGRTGRKRRIEIATPGEAVMIAEHMPDNLQMLVLLGAWCGLRYGELAELRRKDIDVARGYLKVERAVVRVGGRDLVGPPKSEAGVRMVAIPPHILPAVEHHLDRHTGSFGESLLFARSGNRHLIHTEVTKRFAIARKAAGRPDLRLHDLRHTGATMAAQTGATLAELMSRLGHSTPGAAMRYQHTAQGRDAEIAAALSRIAMGARDRSPR